MLFYTVDRSQLLKEGNILELSTKDPHSLPWWSVPGLISDNELQAHLEKLFPEGLSYHGWKYAKTRHTYGVSPNFNLDLSYLSEMNLENIRRSFFPHKHSRFQSIFACETVEEAIRFRNQYGLQSNPIFEIEGEDFFKSDMHFIFNGTQNIAGSLLAHKYWAGQVSQNSLWEIVLKLPARIGREINIASDKALIPA